MKKIELPVTNPLGLHAQNTVLLCRTAAAFQSKIFIRSGKQTESLKDVMAVMSMQVRSGDTITIMIEGKDETEAINALTEIGRKHL